MVLSYDDAGLFFSLFLPLLDFANMKYQVNDLKNIFMNKSRDYAKLREIAGVIWNDVSCIDEYIELRGDSLSEEHREILRSWKKCVSGRFIIERHLKSGSVFLGENNEVYLVKGITSSYEEVFGYQKPPIMVDAHIIPFKDVLITDGLFSSYGVSFGGGYKSMFRDTYLNAKKAGKIITSL